MPVPAFFGFCCSSNSRTRHERGNDTRTSTTLSFRRLLSSRGETLWKTRQQTLKDQTIVKLPIHQQESSSSEEEGTCVYVLSSVSEFERLEHDHGMDKFEKTKGGEGVQPLTECTGDDWLRQRRLVRNAFANIPRLSLEAVESVPFRDIVAWGGSVENEKNGLVDLKQLVLDVSLRWVVRLFRGKDDEVLADACIGLWTQIRAIEKNNLSIVQARKSFVRSFQWDGGILLSLLKSGLTTEEATSNAMNAMIAAFDAVQSLVFWTLWNLSHTPEGMNRCKDELLIQDDHDECIVQENDLSRLAELKQLATQGKPVRWMGLSYLGRALCETIRVYPPVWTLPRTWPVGNDAVAAKLDVLATNGALDRNWDPTNDDDHFIASFGLGKRHCPAGTAALFAAYVLIRRFVFVFDTIKEHQTHRALDSVYLGPTLCVEGSQWFHLGPVRSC